MSTFSAAIAGSLLILASSALASQDWSSKHATVETRWAKTVSSRDPLPDYPRPQFVRSRWKSLNGIWEFGTGEQSTFDRKILVPYAVETAASGIMEHHDRLWYRRSFTVPKNWKGQNVVLHFDAVDYETEVSVNGHRFGVHRGGYEPFSYDVTPFLTSSENQELIVRVFDPTESGGQPRGKQTTKPGGIMYTPTSGIWQTVWMEPVPKVAVDSIKIVPDIDRNEIKLTINSKSAKTAEFTIRDGRTEISKGLITTNELQTIKIDGPAKLWSPKSPFLYGLEIQAIDGNKPTDRVKSYFGMRKISLGKVAGVTRLLLNNQPVFQIGPLDQGYWPESGLTPPTEEALKSDILTMKRFGFNMVRKHIKVEPARWYYWTDRLGLLVWQDMPSPNSYIDNPPPINKPAFEKQVRDVIDNHFNVPSIVMWVVFNESQARHDTARLAHLVKSLDPSRLVNRDSGAGYETNESEVGDVDDVHSYPAPGVSGPSDRQALVCGEYGGLGLIVKGHTWKPDGWGYALLTNPRDVEDVYGQFTAKLLGFRNRNGLSAAVYTQLSDVEIESNGLMTYDRILKVNPSRIALANRFAYPVPVFQTVVPTSEETKQTWRYTFGTPTSDWSNPNFDDQSWQGGPGGFGHSEAPGNPLGTEWSSSDVWLRRSFTIPKTAVSNLKNLMIRDCHDEDIEVFINGVKAYSAEGFIGDYEVRPITKEALSAINPNGENVLAVHCKQTSGGQFVDVGFVYRSHKHQTRP